MQMDMDDAIKVYAAYYLLSRGMLVWAEFCWVWATKEQGDGPQLKETPLQWVRAGTVAMLPLAGDVFLVFYAAVWLAWFTGRVRASAQDPR